MPGGTHPQTPVLPQGPMVGLTPRSRAQVDGAAAAVVRACSWHRGPALRHHGDAGWVQAGAPTRRISLLVPVLCLQGSQ